MILISIWRSFAKRPLPKTREEFETRATLLQLLRDLETFIQVKVDFYQQFHKETESDKKALAQDAKAFLFGVLL